MIFTRNHFLTTTGDVDLLPVHSEIRYALKEANLKEGLLTLTIPSEGGGVVLLESVALESKEVVLETFKKELAKMLREMSFSSIFLTACLPRTLTLPFRGQELCLAPRQDPYVVDFLTTAKRREFLIQLLGDAPESPRAQTPKRR